MIALLKILTFILIFQDWLINIFKPIGYLDEILGVLLPITMLVIISFKRKKIKLFKSEIIAFNCLILFIIVGLIGNFKYNYIDIKSAFISIILTTKAFFVYFSIRIILNTYKIDIHFFDGIINILKKVIYVFVFVAIINIPLGFLKESGIRFGIRTISLGFSHQTELAFFSIISLCIIEFYNSYLNKKSDIKILLSCSLLIVFAGRSKAIVFLIIYIYMMIFLKVFKKVKLKYNIVILPFALYIVIPRIKSEFLNGARGALYKTAIKIANDPFMIGSGFGTFGSHMSRVKYSPLYFNYGINTVWGLSPEKSSFIADTYWAMILGENGWLGLGLMILTLVGIFYPIFKLKYSQRLKLPCYGLIMYSVITSIAEPIYSSNKSVALMIIIAIFISIIKTSNEESINIKENMNLKLST